MSLPGDQEAKPDTPESYWVKAEPGNPQPGQQDSIDAVSAWLRRHHRLLIALGLAALLVGVVIPRLLLSQGTRQFRTEAAVAVQALDAVAAAIEVGVLYADYAKRVADAKVTVDRFLRKWPSDLMPPLRANVSSVMNDFGLTLEAWGERVKGGPWTPSDTDLGVRLLSVPGVEADRYGIHLNTARQVVWARALRDLDQARELLGLAAKATPVSLDKSSVEQELDRIKEDAARREALIRLCETKSSTVALRAEARWLRDEAPKYYAAGWPFLRQTAREYGQRQGAQEFERCMAAEGK